MSERQEGKYYVDFRESGGVVHREPTRMLPELVFTGRTKSQLKIELEQHAKTVEESLGESAWEGRNLGRITQIVRREFLGLFFPSPEIIKLKDDFYTGWFYTTEDEQTYAAFKAEANVSQSPYVRHTRRAYFLLDRTEAEFWNERVKQNPLTVEEIDKLFLSPGLEAHPSYQSLSRLNLRDLTNKIGSTTDSFWNTLRTFDRNDRSDTKREFLRENLLDLEILNQIHYRSHSVVEGEVRNSMEKSEITIFPLGQERGVVRYISDITGRYNIGSSKLTTKTLPMPHNLIRHFQRYGRLGERPMTRAEFETLYRRLVDPNTKLSF